MNNLLNFKSFFKFLGKNKTFTIIDVFGLSISLMFVILITAYTVQELSTDKFQQNADRIYVLANEKDMGSAYHLAYRVQEQFPEVEKVCPVVPNYRGYSVYLSDTKMNADLLFADSTFFGMFSFPLVNGDPDQVFSAKNYAVVSESFARRAFPDRDPLGQIIKINEEVSVMVNGIISDFKKSIFPTCDIIIRMDNIGFFNASIDSESFNNFGSTTVFLQERAGSDLKSREGDMLEYFKKLGVWVFARNLYEEVKLVPLKDVYFSPISSSNALQKGDWKFVMILMSIGILILIFAVINYINLTVAQTGYRAKEMATRRLLGSSRKDLFLRLMMEATLLIFISFVIGLFLALVCVPFANNLLQTKINLLGLISPVSIIVSLLIIVIMGGITGLLPAILISSAKPVDVVKGSFRHKTKMVFSKFFITFQNIITIMLLVATITMAVQINHMVNAPLGYNTKNILDASAFRLGSREKLNTFVNEVSQLASVSRVGLSEGTPFNTGNNWTVDYDGRNVAFQIFVCDTTFFDMMGFQKLRDNNLGTTDGYFLSEQALAETNLGEDTPSFKLGDTNPPVAGIVKDFQLYNIEYKNRPVAIQIKKRADFYPWNVLIEIQGNPNVGYKQVKELYEKISEVEFSGMFLEKRVEESFESQRRTLKIVFVFCAVAILISLLGLFAMSTYFIQQKSREVSLRKVFGSTNKEVLRRLVSTFLNYVLIAFVIATPVIWYIMKQWLSDYSYRISLYPWIFLTAGLFCLLVSFFTVFWQSSIAANSNPVNSIKNE